MAYLAITLNHMRSVKAWADAMGAETSLDLRSFQLEIRARNRYYRLKPRFLGRREGGLFHSDVLVPEATGFIGWLPYGLLRWDLSDDKLAFKRFAQAAGLRVPARWAPGEASQPYLLKRSAGSFGSQITGPWPPGSTSAREPASTSAQGELFAEQFVEGSSLKVWCWGEQAFFAHCRASPCVTGEGSSTVGDLLQPRLAPVGATPARLQDTGVLDACLAHQGLTLASVLPADATAWFDFRYGHDYLPEQPTADSDNVLESLEATVREQVHAAASVLGAELHRRFAAPVLFAVDGVCDPQGQVWWLEMNSNPILPPDGYGPVFQSLFGGRPT
ncbi:MAG TPA: hypothetical protein VFE82_07550 [Ramlibacter sp.]|jgi:hypothetical protein|uniref:hypothetical protein n=1 Tax=Ramlibacter sp. TaxID=1917967 RepID=UPI002D2B3307|nr:hypothetical protein [Ramlibacter sp.]HZY18320.1 hypothetical protein [Ramlibacter sp.]